MSLLRRCVTHRSIPAPGSDRWCPPRIHVTRATRARPYAATVAHRACSRQHPGPSTAGAWAMPSTPARSAERTLTAHENKGNGAAREAGRPAHVHDAYANPYRGDPIGEIVWLEPTDEARGRLELLCGYDADLHPGANRQTNRLRAFLGTHWPTLERAL